MATKLSKRIALIVLIIGIIAAFRIFHLENYFTLSYVKTSQAKIASFYSVHQSLVIISYMIIYIGMTSLSVPGAAVLTLAGGAVFGLVGGTIIVSFASTIGATLACSISRYVLRDWVQNKFCDKLAAVNRGIAAEGAFYLFTLRLIPVFPFFVINLVMGLTKMPLITYYWVSQLGMLPGTIVYVNAGKELSKIHSVSGILSPTLIFSFMLLGLFPIALKKLLSFWRARERKQD
jgi:uncharacterized membrane protein YdjX (TVP38/TMEM64 family)